jgi:Rps23 Pro-64 3,4-dihydroxylase Tpa1-like proline 4-hydroxylase
MTEIFNAKYFLDAEQKRLFNDFNNARPYKNLVLDNFLSEPLALALCDNFPSYDKLNKAYKGLNEYKAEGANFADFDKKFYRLKLAMSSPEFYQWLARVTGIEEVFMTEDKLGAGIHQGVNGSFLDIHIDFNIHPKLNVHRRLNVLIYLQKDWKMEYNGALELWNSSMTKCEKYIYPVFNRCVIFETNEISYHGYTQKITVPEGVTRKSFYAYYYTQERENALAYHDTFFKTLPQDSLGKKITTGVKENLKNSIKSMLKITGITW